MRLIYCLLSTLFIIDANGGVNTFPEPSALSSSPHFTVAVEADAGWTSSFVYSTPARTDGFGSNDQPGRSMSWTTFQTDRRVRLRISCKLGSADDVVIRPLRHRIEADQTDDQTVEFTLDPGMKVSVEFEGATRETCFTGQPHGVPCVMHGLLIFADTIPADDPLASYPEDEIALIAPGLHASVKPIEDLPGRSAHAATLGDANGRSVVRFLPGMHDLGYWQVPNNIEHVHIDPGAVVFGAIDVLPKGREPERFDIEAVYRDAWYTEKLRESFQLTGPGILSGAKLPWHLKKDFSYHSDDHYWEHVKLLQLAVEDITVRDVTLVDSPYWVLSFINDTDKRSRGRFENFKMVGAWTYNNDGLPVPGGDGSIVKDAFIHANDDALKLYNSGGRVENCVIWQGANGAVFQFGWFPKSVEDVRVTNIDVIRNENWYGVGIGNRATFNFADAGGHGVIENILFANVTVEGRILRLFGLKADTPQQLRNFRFHNLRVGGFGAGRLEAPGRNYFIGDISGFEFVDFSIGGEPVTEPEHAWFDFGDGAGKDFVFRTNDLVVP